MAPHRFWRLGGAPYGSVGLSVSIRLEVSTGTHVSTPSRTRTVVIATLAYPIAAVGLLRLVPSPATALFVFGLTALYGAVTRSPIALVYPIGLFVVIVAVAYATDPSCTHNCARPHQWPALVTLAAIFVVVPAEMAMAAGIGAGQLWRARRSRDDCGELPRDNAAQKGWDRSSNGDETR
jgi:hypothetical protein